MQKLKLSVQVSIFLGAYMHVSPLCKLSNALPLGSSNMVSPTPLRHLTFKIVQHEPSAGKFIKPREVQGYQGDCDATLKLPEHVVVIESFFGHSLVGGKRDQTFQTLSLRPDTTRPSNDVYLIKLGTLGKYCGRRKHFFLGETPPRPRLEDNK
ncbi:hypothetical protein BS17DRAFT_778095 [Gyrodon lividus]|nr:hypothetical protein BS17DRAFT_778095 [Gyrodon lividus]